jgi:hypothetical protein
LRKHDCPGHSSANGSDDRQPHPSATTQPLVLPPNFRDVTAEKVGTIIGIVGAVAPKDKPK